MAEITIPVNITEGNKATSTFTAASTSSLNGLTLAFQDTNNVQYSAAIDTSVTVANSTARVIGGSGVSTLSDLAQAVHRSMDQAVKFGITASTKNTSDGSVLMPISLANISPDSPSATLQTATAIAGKAVLTISGNPSNGETFQLIDSDGTSTTFTINTSSTASTTVVGVQSVLGSNSDLATKVAACINSVSALDITATANSPSSGKVLLVQGTSGTASCTTITENVTNFAFAGRADGTGTANKFQEIIDLNGLTLIFDDQDGNQYSAAADNTITKANSTAVKIGTSDVVTINDLAESILNSISQAISNGVTASTKDTADGSETLLVAAGTRSNNTFSLTYSIKGIIGEGNTVSGTLVSGSHVALAASFAAPAKAVMTITGTPSNSDTFALTDVAGTSQTFTIDTSTASDVATAATATIVFTDKPNETSTIVIQDSDGTAIRFEIDNEDNGVSGGNIALNGISAAGGGAAGTATDLFNKVNAQSSLDVTATNPSSGTVVLTQTRAASREIRQLPTSARVGQQQQAQSQVHSQVESTAGRWESPEIPRYPKLLPPLRIQSMASQL